jgi:cyclopropane fatty-acyl-phospholipid synthase-like methyltransferase
VPDDAAGQVRQVREAYERSTARFVRLGQGGVSIHRAVWGPDVTTREQAFHYVEDRLLALLPDRPHPLAVDLGCGVGGSLLHLARRRPDLRAEGVTISPAQAERAEQLVAAAGLADQVRCREGDFLSPPDDLEGTADVVFSIEAFVHGPDPAAYFRSAARLLAPGGRLAVCDDLLTAAGAVPTADARRRLDDFREGWRVGSLVTVEDAVRYAAEAGLVLESNTDLTPYLELRRPRDRAISVALAVARGPLRPRGEYWRMLAGGDALQHCLTGGLIDYRLLVLTRPVAEYDVGA